MTPVLSEMNALIQNMRTDLRGLADYVWEHPELAYQEKLACAYQVKLLRDHGCEVTAGAYGIETAYETVFDNGDGPVFAIAAEYDALPEVGHGCGHNLICTAGVSAFLAVREYMKAHGIHGRLKLLGTPAEEGGSGKVYMQERGCLDGVDAVMMLHPDGLSHMDGGTTALRKFQVEYRGVSVHAAAPEEGRNALDGIMLLFAGINAYRQHMPEFTRIHGVVNDGGHVPNVIPNYARATFFVRSADESWEERLVARFKKIAEGAALMTETEVTVTETDKINMSRKPNMPMDLMYLQLVIEQGLPYRPGITANRGSSDFGNFSQACPGIHGYFAISDHSIPGHSLEYARCAHTDFGFDNALKASAAMAAIAARFLTDAEFREQVKADFNKKASLA